MQERVADVIFFCIFDSEGKDNAMAAKVVVKGYVVGMVQTNVYFLYREGAKEAVLVDPADYGKALADEAGKLGLEIKGIFLTHAHFDHIGGVEELAKLTGARVYISDGEKELIHDTDANLSSQYHNPKTVQPDVFLRDGEMVEIAGMTIRCIQTPGHTEGSCCYYIGETGEEEKGDVGKKPCPPILLSGDTLFEESVGRTDFPTGSMSALVRSVREKLFILPDETLVYPGHGGMTQIGHEKQYNAMV